MRAVLVMGLGLVLVTAALAGEAGYVSDVVEITVRTGPGVDRKIFSMIRSGQALEILETQDDWTHIRLPSGREGWVLSRFVTTTVPAAVRLARIEEKHQRLLGEADAPLREISRLETENQKLSGELDAAGTRLKETKSALAACRADAGDNGGLRAAYKRATARVAQQRLRLAEMESQQARSSRNSTLQWFLAGAGVLFAGFLLGALSRSKRRRSSLL